MARIRKAIPKYIDGTPEEQRRNELYSDMSGAFLTGTTALANVGTFKENEVLQGVGQGAQFGSSIGGMFGPLGGLIGGGIGAIGGGLFGAAQKRKREEEEERQRRMAKYAAMQQYKNENTFGLDSGQSPITFDDGGFTYGPYTLSDAYIPGARPLTTEEKVYYISQIQDSKRAQEQLMISQLDNMIKSMIIPAEEKRKKKKEDEKDQTKSFDFVNRDTSNSSVKAKKFFYADGGTIPAQLEKRNGIKEAILTPDGELTDTDADESHDAQHPDNVTDMLKPGSMVYSAKRYDNKSISMAAQVAKELGVDLDTKNINKLLEKHGKNVSPTEIANMAKKYQSKSTVNSFDTEMLKQRSLEQITGIAEQINNLVNPKQPILNKLPQMPMKGEYGFRVYADGTDNCAGHTAELRWGSIGGQGAWQILKDCPEGCIHESPGKGTEGQTVTAPCVKANVGTPKPPSQGGNQGNGNQGNTPPIGQRGLPNEKCAECMRTAQELGGMTQDQASDYCFGIGACSFKKPVDPNTPPPENIIDQDCYTRCMQSLGVGMSQESADAVCKTRCSSTGKPPEMNSPEDKSENITDRFGQSEEAFPPGMEAEHKATPPFISEDDMPTNEYARRSSNKCAACIQDELDNGLDLDAARAACKATCDRDWNRNNTTKQKYKTSPDTLNFALANTANIFNLMKTRQQHMYPYVNTPYRKTDTIPVSTADHILSTAYPLMQDYMKQGPMGMAASIQAYNTALQGRNEYINQLQGINKNIDVQNTAEYNKNAVINSERFANWGQDATALANMKLMAGPQAMAKAAENSQEYVATVYRRLYEKQMADYLQKASGLPSGSFPTISLPQWMYSMQTPS